MYLVKKGRVVLSNDLIKFKVINHIERYGGSYTRVMYREIKCGLSLNKFRLFLEGMGEEGVILLKEDDFSGYSRWHLVGGGDICEI